MRNWRRDIEAAFAGTTLDRDILEELALHAESTYAALRADGLSEAESSALLDVMTGGWFGAYRAALASRGP